MILNLHKLPKIGDSCSPTRIFRLSNALVPSNRIKIRPSHKPDKPLRHMLFVFFVNIILEIVRVAVAV